MASKFEIKINNFTGGICPSYWSTDYPSLGNKDMAGDMKNVNLIDPAFITQGPGTSTIDNQDGNVSTLIDSILDQSVSSDSSYAVGGNKFYPISSTGVSAPHTIDHASYTGEDAEDLVYFRGDIYYAYNHSNGGDIGKYDVSGDNYYDEWGCDTPINAANSFLGDHPHPMIASGSFFYVGNGNYVTSYDADNTTLIEQDLDLPQDEEIVSLALSGNTLYIGTNRPNISGDNRNIGSIYKWDRNSPTWMNDSIHDIGEVGALYTKNGITFVFHQDQSSGVVALGYISGGSVKDLAYLEGTLPSHKQVTEYENFLTFVSSNKIWAFGSPDDNRIDMFLFQLMEGELSTVGGIATTFGDLLVASTDGSTNYDLSKASGYNTSSYWKSILFDSSDGNRGKSQIDTVIVNFDSLSTGARVDLTLDCNLGGDSTSKTISKANSDISPLIWSPKIQASNFRIEMDWSNGSSSNPVKIKNLKIRGHAL